MKLFKLTKSDINDVEKLLKKVGAVYNNRFAFPYHVYVSPRVSGQIYKAIKNQLKKEYPGITKRKLDSSAGMHFLNLSPCTLKGLPDNIVIVDDVKINEEIESKGQN